MLSIEDVTMWFEHFKTIHQNHQCGASKAAATHKAKHLDLLTNRSKVMSKRHKKTCISVVHVGVSIRIRLKNNYETLIACDKCNSWFHCVCEGLLQIPQDTFVSSVRLSNNNFYM